MYRFNFDSGCNDSINIGENTYMSNEVLVTNDINDTMNTNDIYLKSLKNILTSLDVIDMIHYKDDMTCKSLNVNDYNALICKTELNNIIKKTEKKNVTSNELLAQILEEIIEDDTFDKKNQQKLLNEHIEIFKNCKTTFSNFELFSYFEKNELVILPDLSTFNTKQKISEITLLKSKLDRIKNSLNLHQVNKIYHLLTDIKFNCYFYDIDDNHNKGFFSFESTDTEYLLQIKEKIRKFILTNFFYDKVGYLNDYYLIIDITVNNNNVPYITFIINNRYEETILRPYDVVYSYVNLDDFIYNIQNKIKNNLFKIKNIDRKLFDEKNKFKHSIISKEERKNGKIEYYNNTYKKVLDGHKDWIEEPVENIQDSDEYFYLKLFQKNIDDIKIINNNFTLNKYQSNCSHSFVVELNNETYIINIMSITMTEYKKIKKTNQIEKFKEAYEKAIQKIEYIDTLSLGYGLLPSILKIIIYKQTDKPKNFDYKVFLKESKENYLKSQKLIKERCLIKIDVVLTLLWCSEYRKIYNKLKSKIKEISKTNKELKPELFFLEEEPILKQFDSSEELINFIDFTNKLLQIPVLAYALVAIVDYNDDYFMLYKMSSVADLIAYFIQAKNLLNRRDLTLKIEKLACNHKAFEKVKKISDTNLNRLLDELFSKTITKKSFFLFIYDYIKIVQSSYIAWHTPLDLMVEDYQQLISYLNVIIQVMERKVFKLDYDTKTLSTISTEEVPKSHPQYKPNRETINRFCNFYTLYKDQKFIYNIREANIEQLQKLKQLIEFVEKDDCIAFFHYFSLDIYNILHCHIYKDYFNTSDISRRKIEISYARPILLDKINTKNNDLKLKPYFDKTIIVPFRESISIPKTISEFINQDISKLFEPNHDYALRLGEYVLSNLERMNLGRKNPSLRAQEEASRKQEKRKNSKKLKYLKYKQKYLQLKKLFFD